MNPLVLAAVLASGAELAHAIAASIAIGGIYWTAIARFGAVALLAVFAVMSRQSWVRWSLVASAAWLAVNYGAQSRAHGDLVLALVAVALAASAVLLLATRSTTLGK